MDGQSAVLNQSKQHWYTGSTTGSTENTGMAIVIVFPRDALCSPWLNLSQSLLFRFREKEAKSFCLFFPFCY
jgi:hypothetical protein